MPCISIWLPDLQHVARGILSERDNKAGHVTLTTNKYHISFWPARCFMDGRNRYIDGVDFVRGVEGCLFLNRETDCEYEDNYNPIEYSVDTTVSNEDINSVYEEFLNYNGINPQDVTLAKGEELYQTGNDELSKKLFHRTKYSFSAELVSRKEPSHSRRAFYHQQQSCVSFIFNLIQTAWLKHHPHRPIPFPRPGGWVIFRYTKYVQFAFQVPWFKEVVENYLMTTENINEPSITVESINLSQLQRDLIVFTVCLFALVLLCYFCPQLRYPVAFAGFFLLSDFDLFENLFFNLVLVLVVYFYSLNLLTLVATMWILIVCHCYITEELFPMLFDEDDDYHRFRRPLTKILLLPGYNLFLNVIPSTSDGISGMIKMLTKIITRTNVQRYFSRVFPTKPPSRLRKAKV